MTADWIGMAKNLRAGLRAMRSGAPEVMKAFAARRAQELEAPRRDEDSR